MIEIDQWEMLTVSYARRRPWETRMRTMQFVLGILVCLIGVVWFLQGINVLPGSFMTGQTQWAVYGAIAFVAGLVLIVRARRRGPPSA